MRKSTIFSSGSLRRQIFRVMGLGIAGMLSFSVATAQMSSGTYYVNGNQPTGGNSYQSFADFFSALNSAGNAIASPGILLRVVPQTGGYNEQFTVPSIAGLGPISGGEARLIIRGDGTADTKIHYSASSSTNGYAVVFMNGADYITLDSLMIQNSAGSGYNFGVKIYVNSSNVDITNCTINMRTNGYSSGYAYGIASTDATSFPSGNPNNPTDCYVGNTTIDGGYYNIYWYGASSSSGTWPGNNEFNGNTFKNYYYYGIYTRYSEGLTVHGNTFDGTGAGSAYAYGLYVAYSNNVTVTNNIVTKGSYYGLTIYYCNYYNTGIVSGQSVIANNSVHGNQTAGSGGRGLYVYRGGSFDISYNSVWVGNNITSTSYGMYMYYLTNGTTNVRNNVVKMENGGTSYALYVFQCNFSNFDYNTFYTEKSSAMTYYWLGSSYSGLSALQSGTSGVHVNSQETDPSYVASNDLHVNGAGLYGKGTPISGITLDVDGTTRSATAPSPGIHEFIPPQNDVGVVTFTEPVAQCADTNDIVVVVKNFGILPLTRFNINWSWTGNGATTGNGNLSVTGISIPTGGDTTLYLDDLIMTAGAPGYDFRAYTSLPNNVTDENFDNDTLDYNTQTAMEGDFTIGGTTPDFATFNDAVNGLKNFGVCGAVTFHARGGTYTEQVVIDDLNGVSAINTVTFITDSNNTAPVKIEHTSTSANDDGVWVMDGVSYITVDGYDMENKGSSYASGVYIKGDAHDLTVMNCNVSSSATYFYARTLYVYTYGFDGDNIHILDNTFTGGYYAAYVYGYNGSGPGLDGLRIEGNSFSNADRYGLFVQYFKNATVSGNDVDMMGGSSSAFSYGMMMYGYGTGYEITNNNVEAAYYGMYIYSMSGSASNYGLLANNKVSLGDTALSITSGYYALYFSQSGFFNISHNLFLTQTTRGYAAYFYGGLNHVHNNIFARVNSGSAMYISGSFSVTEMDNNAYLLTNGATSGLSYTQGLGWDANGIQLDSIYARLDSLFTCKDSLVGAGLPLSYVPMDIDGGGRSTTAPTIGPHEYITADGFTLGDDQLLCAGDTLYLGSELSGATYTWNTGDTTGVLEVTSTGTYSVTVTTTCSPPDATSSVIVSNGSSVPAFTPDSSWMTVTFANNSVNATTYLWDFGDGTTSTDFEPVHLYTTKGVFNVCLTATGECDDNTTCQDVRAWDGVGIGEFDASNAISIYPNPASDILTIEASEVPGDVLNIEISNISGQVVMNSQLDDFNGYAKEQLDISELTKGVYFVKIFTNEVTTAKRLVVQK